MNKVQKILSSVDPKFYGPFVGLIIVAVAIIHGIEYVNTLLTGLAEKATTFLEKLSDAVKKRIAELGLFYLTILFLFHVLEIESSTEQILILTVVSQGIRETMGNTAETINKALLEQGNFSSFAVLFIIAYMWQQNNPSSGLKVLKDLFPKQSMFTLKFIRNYYALMEKGVGLYIVFYKFAIPQYKKWKTKRDARASSPNDQANRAAQLRRQGAAQSDVASPD